MHWKKIIQFFSYIKVIRNFMKDKTFLSSHIQDLTLVTPDEKVLNQLIECKNILIKIKKQNKVLIFGNGGSVLSQAILVLI